MQNFVASAEKVASKWLQNAPVFKIQNIRLSALKKRGKNLNADIKYADALIETMKSHPADACSARFLDENGIPLACVFAHNFSPSIKVSPQQLLADIPVSVVY